jgi:hypothetical protein
MDFYSAWEESQSGFSSLVSTKLAEIHRKALWPWLHCATEQVVSFFLCDKLRRQVRFPIIIVREVRRASFVKSVVPFILRSPAMFIKPIFEVIGGALTLLGVVGVVIGLVGLRLMDQAEKRQHQVQAMPQRKSETPLKHAS